MKHKILLISAGILFSSAVVLGSLVFFQKIYKVKKEEQIHLNKISTLVKADYTNKETINPTQIEKKDIKFLGIDENKYEVVVKETKIVNSSSISVKYILKDKQNDSSSYETSVRINGFKKIPASQDKLNEKIDEIISIKYDGDNSKIKTSEVIDNKIIFENFNKNYQILIKNKTVKSADKTVLLVSFVVKDYDGKIESKIKTLELFGFMDPDLIPIPTKTINEINKIANTINAINYKFDKSSILISEIKKDNFYFKDLPNEYEFKILSITNHDENPTVAFVNFTINEKGGLIHSNLKTIEVSGFKKPDKTKEEVNDVLKTINSVYYDGDKTTTEIKNIEESKIVFEKLPDDFEIVFHNIHPNKLDKTAASIIFSIREKGRIFQSTKKEVMISGFKTSSLTPLTKNELNNISSSVRGLKYVGKDIKNIEIKNIDKTLIEFVGLNHFYQIKIVSLNSKNNDQTTAIVNYTINEHGSQITSDIKAIEWNGFKKPSST